MAWPKGVPHPSAGNHNGVRAPSRVAKGVRVSETMLQTGITLDDETFGEIVERAQRAEHSFSAEARGIIEVGLETLKMAGM